MMDAPEGPEIDYSVRVVYNVTNVLRCITFRSRSVNVKSKKIMDVDVLFRLKIGENRIRRNNLNPAYICR